MIDFDTLLLFSLASFVLLITPGPAVIYIVARSVSQGIVPGLVATLGMHTGTLVHVAAAAYGLSQLLVHSSTAFSVVKYLGAAYLIYLGLKAFFGKNESTGKQSEEKRDLLTIFRESIIVNILNPKTALFFFAFLPQFVDPSATTNVSTQIIVLGLVFIAIGIMTDGLYAVFAGTLRDQLTDRGARFGKYLSGAIFTGLGVFTAATDMKK